MTIALAPGNFSSIPDHRPYFQLRRRCRRRVIKPSLLCQQSAPNSNSTLSTQQTAPHFDSKMEEMQIRKCAPFLESDLLPGDTVVASSEWQAVPDIWKHSAQRYGDRVALVDPYHDPPSKMTYKQLEQEILYFSDGIRAIGVKPGEKLALFADNSCRWLVVDQGIMATGAINAVRGSRSSTEELLDIYTHSDSVALAVDNPELFNRIAETFCSQADIRFIILLWGDKSCLDGEVLKEIPVHSYEEIIDLGHQSRMQLLDFNEGRKKYVYEAISSDDVATIVYTSGTSSNPKGVLLTHKNLLHQISCSVDIIGAEPGDRFLSILPPWHTYERAVEYSIFVHGIEHVYTTVKYFKDDLRLYQPNYLIGVPLVFEILYNGIQKQISRSSAARKLVSFFLINISLMHMEFKRIFEGKYLTRSQKQPSFIFSALDGLCARILCGILWPVHILARKLVYSKIHSAIGISKEVKTPAFLKSSSICFSSTTFFNDKDQWNLKLFVKVYKAGISGGGSLPPHVDRFFEAIDIRVQNGYGLTESSPVVAARRPTCNVLGSVGHPLRYTEVKVTDPETGEVLPPGSKGILKVKGPQVMKAYYKNKAATEQILDEDGWLNTGDIGWIAPYHSVGRSRSCGGVVVLEGRAKDTIVLSTGENVEPSELEEAAMRSNLIQQIVIIGQDQRRLGAIVVPNKEEILLAAKENLIVDADATEHSKGRINSLIDDELKKWTSDCSFRIGPILVVDEPFTIENSLMTPTMKIRRDRVADRYKEEIENLYR